jgi:hypothetical protein
VEAYAEVVEGVGDIDEDVRDDDRSRGEQDDAGRSGMPLVRM